jgi:hypothetical protein
MRPMLHVHGACVPLPLLRILEVERRGVLLFFFDRTSAFSANH